jgi:amidase
MATKQQNWGEIGAAKRAALLASIPPEWIIPKHAMPTDDVYDLTTFRESSGLFTEEEIKITEATVVELVDNLSKAKWSAERVATAFCKAATIAHQLVSPRSSNLLEYCSLFANGFVDKLLDRDTFS